ncbi:MAG: MFS transporter [Caulobacterales bacterium]|nr:MFS transporter [Caulobacterales bacterium]
MTREGDDPHTTGGALTRGGAYAWFVVGVLSLASIVAYVDRQIINLMVEPIKADLGVNDTQISLLQGFSFALFYAALALPLARIADSGDRVMLIIAGVVCWSAATFSCGLATAFLALFFARMFVGVGEATLAPAGYSLLGDYFPKERVGLAISVLTGSGFIGSGLAYIIGGYVIGELTELGATALPLLGEREPWQMAFMAVALPGVALVALLALVREPPRRDTVRAAGAGDASLLAVIAYIRAHLPMFAGIFCGLTIIAAGVFGVGSWTPTFLIRVHGWTPMQVGSAFGLLFMVASSGGVVAGGWIASRLMQGGLAGANLVVPACAALTAIPFAIAFPLAPTPAMSLTLMAPALFFAAMPFGCGTAVLPLVAPNRMRAQLVAIYLLIANLLGYTLGPTSIALLTDFVFQDPARIHHALAFAPAVLFLVGAALTASAVRPYARLLSQPG